MSRNRWILATVGLVSMLVGAALFQLLGPDNTDTTAVPPALHSIPLVDLQAQQTLLADYKDILVVNFWAPWCEPCRREIPTLISFQNEYGKRGVQVLGIALDGKDQVRLFAEEYQINYPLFLAGNRISMYNAAFGNPSGSLPFTAVLDRNQNILFRHNGEVTLEQLKTQINLAL